MHPRSYTNHWLTKTKSILVVFLVVAHIFSSLTIPAFFDTVPRAEAAFNAQINYQGKLTNAS
ncbi:MAG TPA: hypothetical protein VK145_03270, partial [Candidatus Nanoarchaeia archaeon]|nr:hypothetical protein [Candidatus Nanoarchaeia archaeon]